MFANHLVTSSTALGVVVVAWDAHNVCGVDLDDHNATLTTMVVWQVAEAAKVQAVGASAVLVLINLVAWHLQHCAHAVVHLASVEVTVVVTHLLVGQEAAVLGDGQCSGFQEAIQLIHSPLAGVLHEIVEEAQHGLSVEVFADHVQDATNHAAAHWHIAVENFAITHSDIALAEVDHALLDVDEALNFCVVLDLERFADLAVMCMICIDGVSDTRKHHNDEIRTNNTCQAIHSVCPLTLFQ